ncbi:MAG: DUF1738 domain-containing protein, partial [Emcibacteraceae bacterium]|nr:DUF1738 domain-containing protein [Emcibacteraceae bacterium]
RDLYQEITDKIIKVLERVDPDGWQAPFAGLAAQGLPLNPTTESHYHGVNIPSLWFDQQEKGFTSNRWATFKQWKEQGAAVRKGEKGSPIIFYKTLVKTEKNERGEDQENHIPMMRSYSVFNANQVDGYDHNEQGTVNEFDLVKRIKAVDQFCTNTGADIRHGGGAGAYYHPAGDYINIPETIAFIDTQGASATQNYYATLLHELTHWTGAPHRLNREKGKEREKYAFEELIADLGAAFLCSQLRIVQTPREDHAHYIKSWLKALKNDKKCIFKASAQAAKAAEYMNTLQGGAA